MLVELRVRNLGVIADLELVLGPGMTAVTGETGAGKTLVVDAIELLVGGRADASMVRAGEGEAVVEGRFVRGDEEVVVRRVVSAQGRSRAYVNGAMATVGELAALGAEFVDLHGQHAHQSLLSAAAQRDALDAFAGIDLSALRAARAERAQLRARLDELGGDPHARAREIDLLAFQVDEIAQAALDDPNEEAALEAAEDRLANTVALREAAATAYAELRDDGAAGDRVRAALSALGHHATFAGVRSRLEGLVAELDDAAAELRTTAEDVEDDPAALAEVRARRQLLVELRRKYGDTVEEVMVFGQRAESRLAELRGRDAETATLAVQLDDAAKAERRAALAVAKARRAAAAPAGAAIESHLHALALPRAELSISVEGDAPADDVAFVFAANPGEQALPLRKVASGGELARVMLALRLVLTSGPPTMVFDEVDAGIGGEAAIAVGQALASLGEQRQVLVVTHLPQVAAFADAQVQVVKQDAGDRVVAAASRLDDADRVVELSRMLAGDSESAAARKHAKELLESARKRRAG
ncbi:MAG TPA: DNA repair protein RecN [Acidimicrobiales bacterium]|nr:DNA repair protein RecN [Acidimicrobiales bacterium]